MGGKGEGRTTVLPRKRCKATWRVCTGLSSEDDRHLSCRAEEREECETHEHGGKHQVQAQDHDGRDKKRKQKQNSREAAPPIANTIRLGNSSGRRAVPSSPKYGWHNLWTSHTTQIFPVQHGTRYRTLPWLWLDLPK